MYNYRLWMQSTMMYTAGRQANEQMMSVTSMCAPFVVCVRRVYHARGRKYR